MSMIWRLTLLRTAKRDAQNDGSVNLAGPPRLKMRLLLMAELVALAMDLKSFVSSGKAGVYCLLTSSLH